VAVVCDRCRTNLDGKEEIEVSSWDAAGSSCEGKDQVAAQLCRKCFNGFKGWFRAWLTPSRSPGARKK
jgi:hypothetical protein